jgi:UDP-glucuronate decarboxylase
MERKYLDAKRVLVTGGAGFLGSNLCDRLFADGQEVVCVDNFSTGSRRNILHLLDHPNFSVLEQDVTNPVELHLAVQPSPMPQGVRVSGQ